MKKKWPSSIVENIRTLRVRKDGTGVVFDIPEDRFSRFMDIFTHLEQTEDRAPDFKVGKCQELPELTEDMTSSDMGGWRGNDFGGGGGGYRPQGKHGRYQSYGGSGAFGSQRMSQGGGGGGWNSRGNRDNDSTHENDRGS